MKIGFKVLKIILLMCLDGLWFLITSQGQFDLFMCHLTVLEAGDDGKAGLESETSSEAKYVRNFVSGPRKKDNFKPGPNKKLPLDEIKKRLAAKEVEVQEAKSTHT